MAAGQELQAALLEIDRRLKTLKALHDHMEQEEAIADAAAFKAEKRMLKLGRMKENDDNHFEEARQWLASIGLGGAADICVDACRADSARWMLGVIHRWTLKICEEARSLHERREQFRESCWR